MPIKSNQKALNTGKVLLGQIATQTSHLHEMEPAFYELIWTIDSQIFTAFNCALLDFSHSFSVALQSCFISVFINILQKQPVHLRLAEASLFTLTAYLGHVSLDQVLANNSVLLQMLCCLLEESELQMAASECLLIIAERRKVSDNILPSRHALPALIHNL